VGLGLDIAHDVRMSSPFPEPANQPPPLPYRSKKATGPGSGPVAAAPLPVLPIDEGTEGGGPAAMTEAQILAMEAGRKGAKAIQRAEPLRFLLRENGRSP
jgi:hypothetical protein